MIGSELPNFGGGDDEVVPHLYCAVGSAHVSRQAGCEFTFRSDNGRPRQQHNVNPPSLGSIAPTRSQDFLPGRSVRPMKISAYASLRESSRHAS